MKPGKMPKTLNLLVLAVFLVMLAAPVASVAGTTGRRNTALGLTAGAIYSAIRGKKTPAIALGAGAVYAWKRHSDARKNQSYKRGYNSGYHRGYRTANYRNAHHYRR